MMANTVLIKDLSLFFEVGSIFIGMGGNFSDNNMDFWSPLAFDLVLGFIDCSVELEGPLKDELVQKGKTLVYFDSAECLASFMEPLGMAAAKSLYLVFPDSMRDLLSPNHLRLDSNWITFNDATLNGDVELYEHYGIGQKRSFVKKLGAWSAEKGVGVPEPSKWRRRSNLEGFNLINTVNPVGGYMTGVLGTLQTVMNISVTNVRPPDGQFGAPKTHPNGSVTWTGVIGELVERRADFSMAGLTVNSERGQAIDFTVGILPEIATLSVGDVLLSRGQLNVWAYLKVFPVATWAVFGLTIVVSGICLYAAEMAFAREGTRPQFAYGFVMVFLTFLQLDAKVGSKLTHKVMYLAIFISCVMVYEGYMAHLTADMTAGIAKTKIKSLQDVLDNDITVYVLTGSDSDQYFASAPKGTTRYEVNKRLINRDDLNYATILEIFPKIAADPQMALFAPAFTKTMEGPKYKLNTIFDFNGRTESVIGIGLQKDSELKGLFDYHVMSMVQSGLLDKMLRKWIDKDKPDDNSDRIFAQDIVVLGFDNLFFPASVFGYGAIAAVVLAMYEKCRRCLFRDVKNVAS